MKNKILVLLPTLGQPRDSKRIQMLNKVGFTTTIAYFDRDYHKGRIPDGKIINLGKLSHGQYFQRVLKYMMSLIKVRKLSKSSNIIYCSGPDMAYFAALASIFLTTKVVMEVGDIRYVQVKKNWVGKFVRSIEKIFVGKCSLIVTTSEKFVTEYYHKMLGVKVPYIVLENKLDMTSVYIGPTLQTNNLPIRIGYFGVLRCSWSWEILTNLVNMNPERFELLVAGFNMGVSNFEENISKIDNINYLGEYKSPDDLEKLYSQVDIIWACYPHPEHNDEKNWEWARTNRFYEALYYNKPLIVLEKSGDSDIVKKHNLGLVISGGDKYKALKELEKLDIQSLNQFADRVRNSPKNLFIYTYEYDNLKTALRNLLV